MQLNLLFVIISYWLMVGIGSPDTWILVLYHVTLQKQEITVIL